MNLSLLLNSSSCLAEEVDDSGAEAFLTPPEGEGSLWNSLSCKGGGEEGGGRGRRGGRREGGLSPVFLHQGGLKDTPIRSTIFLKTANYRPRDKLTQFMTK